MIEPASPRDEPARITASDPWRAHYDRLAAMGAGDFAHVAGTLAPHLANTASLLQQWGNRDALCVAGLYHAVYGTAGIRGELATLARRSAIAEVIGVEAEAIVFVYAACDRDAFHPRIGTPRETRLVDRFTATDYTIPVVRRSSPSTASSSRRSPTGCARTSAMPRSTHAGLCCQPFEPILAAGPTRAAPLQSVTSRRRP